MGTVNCQKYVTGFMICLRTQEVILIKKNRPAFQIGKWNGVGGKIELHESPHAAMVREFWEETGIQTQQSDWELTLTLEGDRDDANNRQAFMVYYFRTFVDEIPRPQQTTDEYVAPMIIPMLYRFPTLDNLKWILPMQTSLGLTFPIHMSWKRGH